jgi:hypothetical protein
MLLTEAQTDRVASTIDWWLKEEVRDAASGHNKVLDDYSRERGGSEGAGESSYLRAKAMSHHDRYQQKIAVFPSAYADADRFYVGSLIHHALMFTAGGFRQECFLRTASQAEYDWLRRPGEPATSLDLASTVEETLSEVEENRLYGLNCLRPFVMWHVNAGDLVLQNHLEALGGDAPPGVALAEDDPKVRASREAQRLGVAMAVSTIVMDVHLNSSFAGVPFLEPRSITKVGPNPIYPFAG